MSLNVFLKALTSAILLFSMSSCLKTRSEVGENEQSQVYSRKNADNQNTSQRESQLNQKSSEAQPVIDERDELIHSLNGRLETLENQIAASQKEKSVAVSEDAQKIQLLQEALTKMEGQVQKLEAEQAQKQAAAEAAAAKMKSSDDNSHDKATTKKGAKEKVANAYEIAQGHFASREWKKAILSYQKYVDDFPKGKEVADAKYKIGVCFQELGMKEESMAFFEEVVANYAKTEAGKKAKIRLAKLKK
jgi:TolA-binding protein